MFQIFGYLSQGVTTVEIHTMTALGCFYQILPTGYMLVTTSQTLGPNTTNGKFGKDAGGKAVPKSSQDD